MVYEITRFIFDWFLFTNISEFMKWNNGHSLNGWYIIVVGQLWTFTHKYQSPIFNWNSRHQQRQFKIKTTIKSNSMPFWICNTTYTFFCPTKLSERCWHLLLELNSILVICIDLFWALIMYIKINSSNWYKYCWINSSKL